MTRAIVVGGGWAGCAAALSARRAGIEVVLLERTDSLLGTGLVGGIMRNNGRFTATEELLAMGGGDLFKLTDQNARHTNVIFPGHQHASLYDVGLMEPMVRRFLLGEGIAVWTVSRVKSVERKEARLQSVMLDNREILEADVFIDATGTVGPAGSCNKFGNGCAMCIMRCAAFGGRVSLVQKAGIKEQVGRRTDGQQGSMSGSCKLHIGSLSDWIKDELDRSGVAIIPVPADLAEKKKDGLSAKCCQQYALPEFADNLILLDTGHAKLMTPYFPLEELRQLPGLENARFEDPYAGSQGNSIRFLALAPRSDTLQVEGVENLFCCGEKAGMLVGHTEAICTGTLAGYNAAGQLTNRPPLKLPATTVIGDFIKHSGEALRAKSLKNKHFTFSGSHYFERMKDLGLYDTDIDTIGARVESAGLTGVFS